MKYKLIWIFLLPGLALNAQTYCPFPTHDAQWTEMYFNPFPDEYTVFHSFALKDGDTVINGKHYHKLYYSTDTSFTEEKLCGAIREENRKIYYYSIDSIPLEYTGIAPATEVLLYDFNLKTGDTIYNYIDQYWIDPYDYLLVVLKSDSILIGTEYRRRLTFGYCATSIIPWAQWVEGVGSLRGLLFMTGEVPTNGLWNDLICFRQEGSLLYHFDYYDYCYYKNPDGFVEETTHQNIKVIPNPAFSSARIELDKQDYTKMIMTDLFGNTVKTFDIQGKLSLEIHRGEMPPGIYFLIFQGNHYAQTIKVIFE